MGMTRINNHMERELRLERPGITPGGLTLPMNAFNSRVVRIPGINPKNGKVSFAEIDFWDQIKNHPIYQNLLERNPPAISIGEINERSVEPVPFTSFGDTLQAADSLDPEIDDDDAANDAIPMNLQRGDMNKPRRGRPPKAINTEEA